MTLVVIEHTSKSFSSFSMFTNKYATDRFVTQQIWKIFDIFAF